MSNFFDNVPVKISEKYKPPPRIYQLPQTIANKLTLSPEYYNQAPQFNYDFQLERKVLAKIPEWRRMRQIERESRNERREKREQERLRDIEVHQKQLLGAVSYPNAEELSSTDSDDEALEEQKHNETEQNTQAAPGDSRKDNTKVVSTIGNNFYNILQPTVLPNATEEELKQKFDKLSSSFNYRDFEDDASTPFDTFALKTINDLDILAQVLHSTQLMAKKEEECKESEENRNEGMQQEKGACENAEHTKNINDNKANTMDNPPLDVSVIEKSLEKVDYSDLNEQLENQNIPNNAPSFQSVTSAFGGNNTSDTQSSYVQQPSAYVHYSQPLYQNVEQHHQYSNYNIVHHAGIYHQHQNQNHNQNYLYTPNCNGVRVRDLSNNATYFSPTHVTTPYVSHNANSFIHPHATFSSPQPQPVTAYDAPETLDTCDLQHKSKSVPDFLAELREEVRNSQQRRTRNHSYTIEDDKEQLATAIPTADAPKKSAIKLSESCQSYASLEAPAQQLAKTISSMGFPLERVAKIAQIFGADDKKIIEHLIPLSELVDLGFDESKISEALMKFDNNKEKALDYLIT